jgi:Amt family ammonium transporter
LNKKTTIMKSVLLLLALVAIVLGNPQDINANLPNQDSGNQNQQSKLGDKVDTAKSAITTLQTALDAANAKLDALEKTASIMEGDLDTMWLVIGAALVFFLTIGFALVEASATRSASLTTILVKNLVVACVVAVIWWAFGYGVAYAAQTDNDTDNAFIGNGKVFLSNDKIVSQREFANWVYSYAFAVFATAIATSSLTDRGTLTAYVVTSVVFSGGIYPVIVHWVWAANGWLNVNNVRANFGYNGMIDWSGSGVVHLTGAIVALVATLLAGPRLRRFDAEFIKANPSRFQSVNKVYQGLGVLFLWVGWYGFTCVSTNLSMSRSQICVKVAANTTLAAAAGALIAFICDAFFGDETVDKQYASNHPEVTEQPKVKRTEIRTTLNGVIAGLVAVSAGVSVYEPWAAVVVGGLGGLHAFLGPRLLAYFNIDDPVETFSLFGFSGMWGLFGVGWFARPENISAAYYGQRTKYGIWYGGDAEQWGVQLFGAGSIMLWALVMGGVLLFVLKVLGVLRVSEEQEALGLNCPPEFVIRDIEMKEKTN